MIKQEVLDYVDIETRIVNLCQSNPKGVTDASIQSVITGVPAQQRVTAINRLLSSGQLELLKSGKTLYYRYKDSQSSGKTKGLEQEEKLIYQIIENSKNIGIWIRDLRFQCNLQMTQVNKVVKNLESRKLIKAVNSVAAGKKKVFMLYNVEPDATVTGGAWYSDQDFESEFVDILNQQCNKFLVDKYQQAESLPMEPLLKRNRSYCSSHEVWKYINELGISKVTLTVQDMETILTSLIYDGKAEAITVFDSGENSSMMQKKWYRAIKPMIPVPGLMRIPCGVCPVIKNCYSGGQVSPETCVYMKDWLDI